MTNTDLANIALSKIGANLIASMDEQPLAQVVMNQTLGALLRGHDWNFAMKIIDMAPLALTEPFPPGFNGGFDLPSDYIRRISLSYGGVPIESVEFRVLGKQIYARVPALTLIYIRKDPPISDWPPDFVEAFTTMVASKLAATLLKDAGTAARLRSQCLLEELPEAKKNDVEDSPASLYVHDQVPAATSPGLRSRRGSRFFQVEGPQ